MNWSKSTERDVRLGTIASPTEPAIGASNNRVWFVAIVVGVAAFDFSLAGLAWLNDHFYRIAAANQIAQYGELPFRDFFDPGYFLTELSSAALLRLLGDNLLGEALLVCGSMSIGTALVWVLARRASGSTLVGLGAAALALLLLPRPYDYDKVVFYPLCVLLVWRYIDKTSLANLWLLATGIVVAGLYRYDNAVFAVATAVVSIATVHARERRVLAIRLLTFSGAGIVLALPVLIFLQFNGGLVNAIDQMLTYGRRETARTWLPRSIGFSFDRLLGVVTIPPPANAILVRWAVGVDDRAREMGEARYGLVEGRVRGAAEGRTWSYRITDPSRPVLRALLTDSAVEDTDGIERAAMRLPPEPWWTRAQRAIPPLRVRVFPGAWHGGNASAFLFYLFRLLPLVALAVLAVTVRSSAHISMRELACVTGLATLCLALNIFIMRDPIGARIGGMAGPFAVLAAWTARRLWSFRLPQDTTRDWPVISKRRGLAMVAFKSVLVLLLLVTVWSISATADWSTRIQIEAMRPRHLLSVLRTHTTSPPPLDLLPNGYLTDMVKYVRECTAPHERVLTTWFAPELPFFARRAFAAGNATPFGGHWSEPRFQTRSVELLRQHSTPIVINRAGDDTFFAFYPTLAKYFDEHYRLAETNDFGDRVGSPGGYEVYVRKDRQPLRVYAATTLPCFY